MTQLGNKAFTYDARNRMMTAAVGATSAVYQYDSKNRRISKTVDSSTIKYCYDGGQIIAEYDGSNVLLRRFVYGPGIDEPICMIAYNSGGTETGRYFYHYDGQGNIVGLSNSSGNLVEQYKYDVYGLVAISCLNPNNQQWESSPVSCADNPYFFIGRELDNETDLYYYRARMYEPQLGRFMQPDPIGYADSMNLYQYCLNNPVNWIDPWGENVYYIDEWGLHSGVAVDIYDENGNVIGQRRFDFSAPPKWYFFLGIVAVKGFVSDQAYDINNDPYAGVQVKEYKSCQKEDEELLKKLEDQVKNPQIYGLFFNNCHQWAARYLSKTGNPWNIGRDIVR